jgi:hypothetical protein
VVKEKSPVYPCFEVRNSTIFRRMKPTPGGVQGAVMVVDEDARSDAGTMAGNDAVKTSYLNPKKAEPHQGGPMIPQAKEVVAPAASMLKHHHPSATPAEGVDEGTRKCLVLSDVGAPAVGANCAGIEMIAESITAITATVANPLKPVQDVHEHLEGHWAVEDTSLGGKSDVPKGVAMFSCSGEDSKSCADRGSTISTEHKELDDNDKNEEHEVDLKLKPGCKLKCEAFGDACDGSRRIDPTATALSLTGDDAALLVEAAEARISIRDTNSQDSTSSNATETGGGTERIMSGVEVGTSKGLTEPNETELDAGVDYSNGAKIGSAGRLLLDLLGVQKTDDIAENDEQDSIQPQNTEDNAEEKDECAIVKDKDINFSEMHHPGTVAWVTATRSLARSATKSSMHDACRYDVAQLDKILAQLSGRNFFLAGSSESVRQLAGRPEIERQTKLIWNETLAMLKKPLQMLQARKTTNKKSTTRKTNYSKSEFASESDDQDDERYDETRDNCTNVERCEESSEEDEVLYPGEHDIAFGRGGSSMAAETHGKKYWYIPNAGSRAFVEAIQSIVEQDCQDLSAAVKPFNIETKMRILERLPGQEFFFSDEGAEWKVASGPDVYNRCRSEYGKSSREYRNFQKGNQKPDNSTGPTKQSHPRLRGTERRKKAHSASPRKEDVCFWNARYGGTMAWRDAVQQVVLKNHKAHSRLNESLLQDVLRELNTGYAGRRFYARPFGGTASDAEVFEKTNRRYTAFVTDLHRKLSASKSTRKTPPGRSATLRRNADSQPTVRKAPSPSNEVASNKRASLPRKSKSPATIGDHSAPPPAKRLKAKLAKLNKAKRVGVAREAPAPALPAGGMNINEKVNDMLEACNKDSEDAKQSTDDAALILRVIHAEPKKEFLEALGEVSWSDDMRKSANDEQLDWAERHAASVLAKCMEPIEAHVAVFLEKFGDEEAP